MNSPRYCPVMFEYCFRNCDGDTEFEFPPIHLSIGAITTCEGSIVHCNLQAPNFLMNCKRSHISKSKQIGIKISKKMKNLKNVKSTLVSKGADEDSPIEFRRRELAVAKSGDICQFDE